MSLCQTGLYEDITEHFIYDNCACQIGKGTDFALRRVKAHMREFYSEHGRDGWVLKCDVKQFFPSTLHSVAKAAIDKRVEDERAKQMVFQVIDSFGGDRGIGLGSQISQLVELAVLDDLDHMIKERLHIRHYVRYMDDLILIHEDKEYLKYCWGVIEKELNAIGLELNKKTTMYPFKQGIKFLQWHFTISETGKIAMRMNSKKLGMERRRIKRLITKEINGEVVEGTTHNSMTAWRANAKRGDAYNQEIQMRNYYYNEKARAINDYRKRNGTSFGT